MTRKTAVVTGSSGLIGSEMVAMLDGLGWTVHGVDNNMRREFFGPDGDTTANLRRLQAETRHFEHHSLDVRDREGTARLLAEIRPDLIVHAAAQPSHDLAARRPFDDFEVNATGTLNLLEAARASCPESPFAFLSTNKVYGDVPNELELVELETRYDYADPALREGIDESCRIDATTHSLFGASKAAADLLVQEYGRYFGMPTVCFRGGCLTGSNHASAELHGFLAYLVRCVRERRPYRIYGYKGKQVRDNIHAHRRVPGDPRLLGAPARRRRLQPRRGPAELGLDPGGDLPHRGARRREARARVRGRAPPRRPHLLHHATSAASGPTIPSGA